MVKNILAAAGAILGGGLAILVAYEWGLDDGMHPKSNQGWLASYSRELFKQMYPDRD